MPEFCPICGETVATDGERTWCNGDQCPFSESAVELEDFFGIRKAISDRIAEMFLKRRDDAS